MKHLLCFLAAALLGAVGVSTATAGDYGPPPPDKVFVCKYVGTPGTDERLQTGQNPISVSINSISGFPGVGGFFADAQGRSLVVAFDTGQDEPSCPDGQGCPEGQDCTPPIDYCPTLPGVQAEDEDCPPPPPVDVCPNLEGVQETIPPGMGIVNGECVPVGINPQCAPPAVIVDGVCIVPPPPPVNPPNVRGDANVFCDRGAQLYRITGTIDGNTIDTSIPITIAGNTRGFTNITLVRGDTQFRTVVFTYGDCSVAPPVITATPAVVTTPAAPVTPAKPAAPAKPAKPAAKPKPKPKPAPKAKPKPKPKVVPHKPGPHVCTTLADGTKRHWWKGGNGMAAGCYPIIKGSG